MINILVLEDDVKLNQIVCTYLNDSGFHAKGCLNANARIVLSIFVKPFQFYGSLLK